ncbi:hypothetical protein GH733_002327 [Mirounga leonina]|nr:hypothetical protein GH733_002327 [Mirounga leonina]
MRVAKHPDILLAQNQMFNDVKPWDDETDMAKLEECVRSIQDFQCLSNAAIAVQEVILKSGPRY